MGTFHTSCTVANIADRDRKRSLDGFLVDTGSKYTWIPRAELESIGVQREKKDLRFVMANGQTITRSVGFAVLYVEDEFTVDQVVFAEPGDLLLLGARTLEGMNLRVDAAQKRLVTAGPLPAAGTENDMPEVGHG